MKRATWLDRLWFSVCVVSFGCYVAWSEAVPAFIREVARLLGKL